MSNDIERIKEMLPQWWMDDMSEECEERLNNFIKNTIKTVEARNEGDNYEELYSNDIPSVPRWVLEAVLYVKYPDRFKHLEYYLER